MRDLTSKSKVVRDLTSKNSRYTAAKRQLFTVDESEFMLDCHATVHVNPITVIFPKA